MIIIVCILAAALIAVIAYCMKLRKEVLRLQAASVQNALYKRAWFSCLWGAARDPFRNMPDGHHVNRWDVGSVVDNDMDLERQLAEETDPNEAISLLAMEVPKIIDRLAREEDAGKGSYPEFRFLMDKYSPRL